MNACITPTIDMTQALPRLRCLWVSRDIPFPQDAGDRIYSGNLAAALTRANVEVCFLGYLPIDATTLPDDWVTQWIAVTGEKGDMRLALLSGYPRIAAIHATPSYRNLLQQQLAEPWDVIILDGYASGWALSQCLEARDHSTTHPLIVYVSHNHEESLWRDMLSATPAFSIRWLGVWQNYYKARRMERALIKHADLVSTITAEDAESYARLRLHHKHQVNPLVLTPGYTGTRRAHRHITQTTPRRVVVMGSFRWLIKQENLRQLVAAADSLFAKHNIILDVIGDVPVELKRELSAQVRATTFHGFVADASSYLDQARIALVPDVVGGGFKLKFLDYIFARMPIAAISKATAGVPAVLAPHMICRNDLDALIKAVVADIDDLDKLNRLQDQAYLHAGPLFNWDTRGEELARAVQLLQCDDSTIVLSEIKYLRSSHSPVKHKQSEIKHE